MQQSLFEPPVVEPVSVAQAICHLRENDDTAQTDLIRGWIHDARETVEGYTKNALVRQVWRVTFDHFPTLVELPIIPVRSILSIQYVDSAGATQTWAASKYQVDLITSDRVRVRPVFGETWPSTQPNTFNAVTINFVAGYAVPFSTDFDTKANQFDATAHPLSNADVLQLWTHGTLPDGLSLKANYHVVNATTDAFEVSATSAGSPIAMTTDGENQHFAGRIPEPIMSAMLLLIKHRYDNRDFVVAGALHEIPWGVESLLLPYTSIRF